MNSLKAHSILALIFTMFNAYSQTCMLESEIPSTTPDSRFTDNGDGTVSDHGTELMWQKCALGLSGNDCSSGSEMHLTWEQALEEASNNSLAEYENWRLPNLKELLSIVEQRCKDPAINVNYFPISSPNYIWTSSPAASPTEHAWRVVFSYGGSSDISRDIPQYVRLVRYIQ